MKVALTTIIIDDEPLARTILEGFVAICPQLQHAGSFDNAIAARSYLTNNSVDLILLDINLPDLSGVDLMRSLASPPMVIFTTAYPQYAVEGFEIDAIDYLLKPIAFERFKRAVSKACERQQSLSSSTHFIMLKSNKRHFKVDLSAILYFEATGDYVKTRTNTQAIIVHETIKSIESQLPPSQFLRIHKSYIIAIDKIEYLEGNQVKVADQLLPVGLSYKDELTKRLSIKGKN